VDCSLLALPKPIAITYGLCCNELMFYEVPDSDGINSNTMVERCVGLLWMVVT
jgi:hypothetical protein